MKTISLKKVSAVAVASLGFGLLSVVPANAALTSTAVVINAPTTATKSTAVGTAVSFDFTVTTTGTPTTGSNNDEFTITASVVKPGDSSAAVAAAGAATTTSAAFNMTKASDPTNWTITNSTNALLLKAGASSAALTASALTTLTFVPDKAGVYTLTLTPTVLGNGTAPTLTAASVVVFAGFDAGGTTNVRRAAPTQGSNTTTGWAATAGGQATVRVTNMAAAATYFVTTDTGAIISGTGSSVGSRTGTVTNTNGTNLGGGFNFTTSSATTSDYMDVKIADTGSPATTTVKVVTYDATTGASSTFVTATVTWGVAAAPSAQYSLLTLNAGTGTDASGAAADTTATVASKSTGTERFRIQVVVKDQYNVAYTGATLAASLSGTAGSLGIASGTGGGSVAGSSLSVALTNASAGSISVFGNGVAGTAKITITATTAAGVTTTLGSKTVIFAGSPAKATATQNLYVAAAGTQLGATPTTTAAVATSFATTPAFSVEVVDSNGNDVVAGSTVKMTSSDTTVITVGACAELTVSAYPGNFECSVSGAAGAASGKSATVTFSVLNSTTGLYDILANALTFTVGGAIDKVVVTADKTSYTAGGAVNLLATATDSSGNKAYDGQAWQLSSAAAASNKSLGGALPASTKYIVNGKQSTTSSTGTASLFAPSTPGSFTISGKYAATTAAPLGTAWSVTASVEDGNAALLTQIDALNAKIVALNALIAKIMKKLGVK